MQSFQTLYDLNENAPDVILFEISLLLLMLRNFLEKVSIVGILHYDTNKNQQMRYIRLLFELLKLTIEKTMLRR